MASRRYVMKRRSLVSALARAGVVLGSLLGLVAVSDAAAQSATSRNGSDTALAGVVHDPTDAAIPRATIAVRHERSGLEQLTEGAADGSFLIRRLPAGAFVVTVSAPGFAPASQRVEVPGAAPLTITLSPAPIVE